MPANGLTQRTIGRIAGRHFQDEVQVFRWNGIVDETDVWVDLGLYNCKLINRSGVSFTPNSAGQAYDATVIVIGGTDLAAPNERYRLAVTQYKTAVESDAADPEVKRTRDFEIVNVEVTPDNVGTDIFQTLRVKNAVAA